MEFDFAFLSGDGITLDVCLGEKGIALVLNLIMLPILHICCTKMAAAYSVLLIMMCHFHYPDKFKIFHEKYHTDLPRLQVHSKGINFELVEKLLMDMEKKFKGRASVNE